MGLEKLINKGRKGIATLGILGILGGVGCVETLTEGEIATIAGEVLIEKGKSDLEKLAGRVLLSAGTMKYQKELAEAGRTQIIYQNVNYDEGKYSPKEGYTWVNPEDSNDYKVKPIFGSGFSFRWVDYNGSGKVDGSNEIIEVKNRFKQDESFCLLLCYSSEEPFNRKMTIYSPKGIGIATWEVDPRAKYHIVKTLDGDPNNYREIKGQEFVEQFGTDTGNEGVVLGINKDMIKWLLERYGEGEYSAVWWVDGKIMDSITFDIIY